MSDADPAAYLDERLHGLEEALHNVEGGIAAYSGAMQSTLQRITAAEWHIDKVRSAAAVKFSLVPHHYQWCSLLQMSLPHIPHRLMQGYKQV